MIQWLRLAPLVALIALAGATVWWLAHFRAEFVRVSHERDDALLALAGANAVVAQQAEAARVHRIYLRDAQAAAADAAELVRDLRELEGRDAPLSDHLLRGAGRVWP